MHNNSKWCKEFPDRNPATIKGFPEDIIPIQQHRPNHPCDKQDKHEEGPGDFIPFLHVGEGRCVEGMLDVIEGLSRGTLS